MIVSHMIWSYTAWSRWSNYTFRILLYISEYIATIATTESTPVFSLGLGVLVVSFRHFINCKRCTMDLWLLISSPFMWAWVLAIAARNGTMANIDVWKTMENVQQKKKLQWEWIKKAPRNLLIFLLVDVFLFDSPPYSSGDEHTNASEIVKEAAPWSLAMWVGCMYVMYTVYTHNYIHLFFHIMYWKFVLFVFDLFLCPTKPAICHKENKTLSS